MATFFTCKGCYHTASLEDINAARQAAADELGGGDLEVTVEPISSGDVLHCDQCDDGEMVSMDIPEAPVVESAADGMVPGLDEGVGAPEDIVTEDVIPAGEDLGEKDAMVIEPVPVANPNMEAVVSPASSEDGLLKEFGINADNLRRYLDYSKGVAQ